MCLDIHIRTWPYLTLSMLSPKSYGSMNAVFYCRIAPLVERKLACQTLLTITVVSYISVYVSTRGISRPSIVFVRQILHAEVSFAFVSQILSKFTSLRIYFLVCRVSCGRGTLHEKSALIFRATPVGPKETLWVSFNFK